MPVSFPASFNRPQLAIEPGFIDQQQQDSTQGITTLYKLLQASAQSNPHHLYAIQFSHTISIQDATYITHSDLLRAVDQCTEWLVAKRIAQRSRRYPSGSATVQRGKPVAIFLGSDLNIFVHLLALVKLGNPFLLLSARLSSEAVQHLLKGSSAAFVMTTERVWANAGLTSDYGSLITDGDTFDRSRCEEAACLPIQAEPLSFWLDQKKQFSPPGENENAFEGDEVDPNDCSVAIFHSTGSTGLPKLIPHCHRYLLGYANCHELPPSLDVEHDVTLSTLPLYHGFGLLAVCLSLSIGMPIALPAATTCPSGVSVAQMLVQCRAARIFTVPSILGEVRELQNTTSSRSIDATGEADGLKLLQNLKLVVVGGAPMRVELAEYLAGQGVSLLNHFGVTEIGALAPVLHPVPELQYDPKYLLIRRDIPLRFQKGQGPAGEEYLQIGTRPFGWTKDFWLQDSLEHNTNAGDDRPQVRIRGRVDDVIVLATGEKVNPMSIESAIRKHPTVNDAVAFGTNRFQVGLLVELRFDQVIPSMNGSLDGKAQQLTAEILGLLKEANSAADGHAQVDPVLVLFTNPATKALPRTFKGNAQRPQCEAEFAVEIDEAYLRLQSTVIKSVAGEAGSDFVLSNGRDHLHRQIVDFVRGHLPSCREMSYSDLLELDLFELGMDSYRAVKLERALVQAYQRSSLNGSPAPLPNGIVYRYPTVTKLADAVLTLKNRSETDNSIQHEQSQEERLGRSVEQGVQAFERETTYLEEAFAVQQGTNEGRRILVLTGATGSLGRYVLKTLLRDQCTDNEGYDHIVCLVRHQQNSLEKERLIVCLKQAGVKWSCEDDAKLSVWPSDLSKPRLGLDSAQFAKLTTNPLTIVHCAWPMDFLRPLESLQPHVNALGRLASLGQFAGASSPGQRSHLIFASSISVVAHWTPPQGRDSIATVVPETRMPDLASTAGLGYAHAKLACEHLLETLDRQLSKAGGCHLDSTVVRIGQLSGAELSGEWTTAEHMAMIVRSSKTIGALPRLTGDASWIPVDRAAKVLVEMADRNSRRDCLAQSKKETHAILHLENEARRAWSDILAIFARSLGLRSSDTRDWDDWLSAVEKIHNQSEAESGEKAVDPNPCMKILDFLRDDFIRLGSGGVVLDLQKAKAASITLSNSEAISDELIQRYLDDWKRQGWLQTETHRAVNQSTTSSNSD